MTEVNAVAHTAGPWTISALDGRTIGPVRVLKAHGTDVPQLLGVARVLDRLDTDANARLIASAPDLLAAAKQVAADFGLQIRGSRAVNYMQHWQELIAAIQKAEGR